MEGIALGCLTALIVARVRFSRSTLRFLGAGGAAIVICSLVFSWQAYRGWLGRTGLNMTLLDLGTCMFMAATAQAQWRCPRFLTPVLRMGQYSYEIYLTHMFVVFTFFDAFLVLGKPMRLVPVLFLVTILAAGTSGVAGCDLLLRADGTDFFEIGGKGLLPPLSSPVLLHARRSQGLETRRGPPKLLLPRHCIMALRVCR